VLVPLPQLDAVAEAAAVAETVADPDTVGVVEGV
jgi:hypothetical protein